MTQITRVPEGLQDFLGTQAQGKNPSELSPTVAPTVDMGRFYALRTEKWHTEGFGTFTASILDSISVPEGELWILKTCVMEHAVSVFGAAGDGYLGSFQISNNSNSAAPLTSHPVCGNLPYVLQVGSGRTVYAACEVDDVLCPPGTQITAFIGNVVVAGGTTFNSKWGIRYLKLDI